MIDMACYGMNCHHTYVPKIKCEGKPLLQHPANPDAAPDKFPTQNSLKSKCKIMIFKRS